MKQKLLITLLVAFLNISTIYSQTTLDIVRASNFYSKAVGFYDNGAYKTALTNLKEAETNLKGKTNKDLEFLKIMSNYKTKNYKEAYTLVKTYFEVGYKDRNQYFRNIETYKEKHNVSYDEILTEIFIELEEKYNVVTNLSPDEVIKSIVTRIKNEKKSIEPFIWKVTDKYEYVSGVKLTRDSEIRKNGKLQYSISFDNTDNKSMHAWCGVSVNFEENISINEYSYNYTFRYVGNSNAEANCVSIYDNNNNVSYTAQNRALKAMKTYNFCSTKSQSNSFQFTENEVVLLQQPGNLDKLKQALKKASLL